MPFVLKKQLVDDWESITREPQVCNYLLGVCPHVLMLFRTAVASGEAASHSKRITDVAAVPRVQAKEAGGEADAGIRGGHGRHSDLFQSSTGHHPPLQVRHGVKWHNPPS